MEFTIALPEDWLAQAWENSHWWYVPILTAVYGFLTHLKTLPAIHRWNAKVEKDQLRQDDEKKLSIALILTKPKLLAILALRMTFALPWRIGCFMVGLVWVVLSILCSGKPTIRRNILLREGWQWHMSPSWLGNEFK